MTNRNRGTGTAVPRWVKVLGLVVLLLGLLAVGAMLLLPDGDGGGGHTPRRHGSAATPAVERPAGLQWQEAGARG